MRAVRRLVTCTILAIAPLACVSLDITECADGWLCGAKQVCDPRGAGCVLDDLVAACDGQTDGSACEAPTLGTGSCDGGVCVRAICGDGVVNDGEQCDAGDGNAAAPNAACRVDCLLPQCGDGIVDDLRGEACDDGNRVDGDGCRPDCGSTETCSNHIIDFAVGELCDDGALLPGDGCSTTCSPEAPIWTKRLIALASTGGDFVLDPGRQRVVHVGATTDEWDGMAWRQLAPRVSPGLRSAPAIAYDPIRRTVVLFGGFRGQTDRNDLWEWDGFDWRQRMTAVAPSPRQGARLAFDPVTKTMILFGGVSGEAANPAATFHDDTWSWDGVQWTRLSPATSPSPRAYPAVATDPVRNEVVLLGGRRVELSAGTLVYTDHADTWTWDGATWTLRIQSGPVPRAGAQRALAFDRELGRLVRQPALVSGERMWSWTGTSWSDDSPVPNTTVRGLVPDPVTGVAVLVASNGELRRRTGTSWTVIASPASPAPRTDAGIAAWARTGRVVLFGGTDGNANQPTPYADTWEWDGLAWTETTTTSGTPPPGGFTTAMAEDPVDGILLVAGSATWRYDSAGWHALPAPTPSGLLEPIMTFDRARNVVVLVGAAFGGPILQTWEWDGVAWTNVTPSATPPWRYAASITYDARLGRVIIFGGFQLVIGVGFTTFGDAWAWDGTSWTPLPDGPPARGRGALGFDPDRARTILFGGLGGGGEFGASLGDTWELDGTSWRPLDFDVLPPGRTTPHIASDPLGGLVMFGGLGISPIGSATILGDTWRFGYGPDSSTCATGIDLHGAGAGCADPACWHACSPTCPPGTSCAADAPRCGDGTCSSLETCRSCPADCAPCSPACGDSLCEGGEATSCPGDCP